MIRRQKTSTGPPSEAGQAFPPHALRDYALLAGRERGAIIGPRGEIASLCARRLICAAGLRAAASTWHWLAWNRGSAERRPGMRSSHRIVADAATPQCPFPA